MCVILIVDCVCLVVSILTAVPVVHMLKPSDGRLPFLVEWAHKLLDYLDHQCAPAHFLFGWEQEFSTGTDP
jgi:hypothetical protein